MKNGSKKTMALRLQRETVRVLGVMQLADVVGGSAGATEATCWSSSVDNGPTHRPILKN
jgi:homoserine acetyltransferase